MAKAKRGNATGSGGDEKRWYAQYGEMQLSKGNDTHRQAKAGRRIAATSKGDAKRRAERYGTAKDWTARIGNVNGLAW